MEKENNYCERIDDEMLKVEVNLDDIPGEWLGYLMEQLLDLGAKDVYYIPIYMKKNRPGIMLQLLCKIRLLPTIKEILFKETTTLGIRYYPITVYRLERRFIKVDSPWGGISVKIGLYQGQTVQSSPEYEDCKRIAEKNQIPLKQVYQYVWEKIREL